MPRDAGIEARRVAGALCSMRIDELISHLAIGIAIGQTELDKACMEIAKFMGEARIAFGKKPGRSVPDELSLIELGFAPNFYQFVDTILEVNVAISSAYERTYEYNREQTVGNTTSYEAHSEYSNTERTKTKSPSIDLGFFTTGGSVSKKYQRASGSRDYGSKSLKITTVDAKYSSTYNYSVEASSTIKTKIVPIPAPQVYEERISLLVQQMKEQEERLSLLDEIKDMINGTITTAQEIGGDHAFGGEGFGGGNDVLGMSMPTNRADLDLDKATSLDDGIRKLLELHEKITTDHWTLTRSVEDRRAADTSLSTISQESTNLLGSFEDDGSLKDIADVSNDTLNGYITKIGTELKDYRDKMKRILSALQDEEAKREP